MREFFREIVLSIITLLCIVFIIFGVTERLEEIIYFASFRSYLKALSIGLFFLLLFSLIPSLRKVRVVFVFMQTFLLGFLCSEIVYRLFHPKLNLLYPGSPYLVMLWHFDYYFLHRLYQTIPLSLLLILFFSYPAGSFSRCLRWGDINAHTDLLRSRRNTWKKITFFFLAILFTVSVVLVLISIFFPAHTGGKRFYEYSLWWTILAPITLYAVITAFLEESFFRGIFLPVFTKFFDERGNLYQALLFGGIHYDITQPGKSILKLMIFTFIGWLWGRATKETRGIGTGFLMHFSIIMAIELRMWLFF